jgi:signal transduction histidine kinase
MQADRDMLYTIFRNLISNAIKYTEEKGEVKVMAEEATDTVSFTIKDNGVGMPPDRVANLFSISHVQSTPGTHQETGTGIGLILCKEFVDQHRGTIEVFSTPGSGTEFRIRIPKEEALDAVGEASQITQNKEG